MNYIQRKNIKLALIILKKTYINLNIVKSCGTCGYIICYTTSNGNNQFNILNLDGELILNKWCDSYITNEDGECIIGYKKNEDDIKRSLKIDCYKNINELFDIYTYNWGAINKYGIFNVKPIYDRLDFGNEHTYIAYYDGKEGYIDSNTGKQITSIEFYRAKKFSNGIAEVKLLNGDTKFIKRSQPVFNDINSPKEISQTTNLKKL